MVNTGLANRKYPNTGGWQDRHDRAWSMGIQNGPFENGGVMMLKGWRDYATAHKERYEDTISNDGFLGREWLALGKSLRALLNGETGRLDCGTVDAFILDTLAEHGFSEGDL